MAMCFRPTFVFAKMAPKIVALATSLALALAPTFALAQSAVVATPVPNAKQTFVDSNGKPYSGGKIYSYVPGTSVPKTTWSDTGEANPNSNPVVLDSAGRATIFGQGNYRQVLKDSLGNTIWDGFTIAPGSASPSGATGTDTAPVGTVMPFTGFAVPTNWALAYGQTLTRASYPELLAALTISDTTVLCTSTSTTLTGFADTSQIRIGAPIEASCLPTGTTIATVPTATTVTVNNAATSTGTVTATVFPWGNGDGTLTFNVPDLRGRTFAGADAMGGTAASRLTSTYYGAAANAPGIAGGGQSQALSSTNQLPQFTPSGTVSTPTITTNYASLTVSTGTSRILCDPLGCGTGTAGSASSSTPTFTGNPVGSASPSAFGVVQPTITVNYIIKVKPNSTGAGGVVSWGGLIGDIAVDSTLRAYTSGGVNYAGCTTMTNSQVGCGKPDGTTVIVDGTGTMSAVAGIASQINVGTTTIAGGTNTQVLYNNAGILGTRDSHISIAGTSVDLGGSITASAILDSIGSTRGSLLERGAASWDAITPGIAGYPLLSGGPGADPAYGLLNVGAAVTGLLTLAHGGTGADLSATGGANSFVKQTSAGGAFTVATISSADLASPLSAPPAIGSGTPNTVATNGLTLSTVTGSTQCLQVNALGVVSGTGGVCGGGGVWTASVNDIYNNNSGNVGVGTSVPLMKFSVSGSQGVPANSGTAPTGAARFTTGNNALDFGSLASGDSWIQATDITNQALHYNILMQPNGGKISIGNITAPTGVLDVYTPSAAIGCCSPLGALANLAHGSPGSPVSVANTPSVIISRYETTTGAGGDSSSEPALLVWEQASGTNQPNAIVGRAYVTASGNADAVGVYGTGQTDSTAASGKTAYASFFAATSNVAGSHAVAMGTNIANNTGGDDTNMFGADLVYASANHGGSAVLARSTGAGQWSHVVQVTSNIHADALSFAGISVTGNLLYLPATGFSVGGFGASSAGNEFLCFNTGNNQITYNGTACNPSDGRMKQVTSAHVPGLSAIRKLRPVSFNWLDRAQAAEAGPQIGLIAQEVRKVAPQVVGVSSVPTTITLASGEKRVIENPENIDYAKLTVPLIAAVQELDAEVRQLRAQVQALRK